MAGAMRGVQAISMARLLCWEPNFTPDKAEWLAFVDHGDGKHADFSQNPR
jgi:hypothetical protein